MRRKYVYVAIAVGLGGLLAWWLSKGSSTTPKPVGGSILLGDEFAIDSTVHSTPPELLSPETVTLGPGNLVIN